MKRILLLEISHTGHHPGYARHILESGIPEDAQIFVAGTQELLSHQELSAVRSRITPIILQFSAEEQKRLADFSFIGLMRREFTIRGIYARAWQQACSAGAIDMVIIPFLDNCAQAFAIAGAPFAATPWIAITMRTQIHFASMGVIAPPPSLVGVRRWLFQRLLKQKNLKELLTIDATLAEFATQQSAAGYTKVSYLPDPSELYPLVPKQEARQQLNLPQNCQLILAYGALSERKGIFRLMQAMADPECPSSVHVLLAGGQDRGVREFLNGPIASSLQSAGRLHLLPGYVPESLVPTLISASDAMWIGYIHFYMMSGVLVLAARHGLPAITSQEGVIGYLVKKYGIGVGVDSKENHTVLNALQQVASGSVDLSFTVERARNFFAGNSWEEFGHRIRMAATAAMGGTTASTQAIKTIAQ